MIPFDDHDFLIFCEAFSFESATEEFSLTTDEVDPFYADMPPGGLDRLDS
ncbi:MAG: hypothetical protein U0892_16310 [Pirellulales bacterium]